MNPPIPDWVPVSAPRVTNPVTRAVTLLFGAGASAGAGDVSPENPPLGNQLFSRLRDHYSTTWGTVTGNLQALFGENFELGMAQVWEEGLPLATLLLVDMGRYFLKFELRGDKRDCYSRLIASLIAGGILDRCAIASLYYECLLDNAVYQLAVPFRYEGRPQRGSLTIWKPHGSCNFMPAMDMYGRDNTFSHVTNIYDGGIRPVRPEQALVMYGRDYIFPPAMSLFAPGKESPVAARFIEPIRSDFRAWVEKSTLIVVIGARPLLADTHIWGPVIDSDARIVYIGGTASPAYQEFAEALGGTERLQQLGDRFDSALPDLQRLLMGGEAAASAPVAT